MKKLNGEATILAIGTAKYFGKLCHLNVKNHLTMPFSLKSCFALRFPEGYLFSGRLYKSIS